MVDSTNRARLLAAQKRAADVHLQHLANIADLKAQRAAFIASWPDADAALEKQISEQRAAHAARRADHMAKLDAGMAAFSEATGMPAKWEA